jgi:hypothetical protein
MQAHIFPVMSGMQAHFARWALAFSYFYLAVLTNPLPEELSPAGAGYGSHSD